MPRFDVEITGAAVVVKMLNNYSGKALAKAAQTGLKKGMQRVAVPAIKAEAPEGHNSPWSRDGEKYAKMKKKGGPLKRKVSVLVARKRPGEMAAVRAMPRTWYDHFVIPGTKAHVITASDSTGRASSRIVRVINRHAGTSAALVYNGIFRSQVRHPGAKPNPFVTRAATRHGLKDALASAINDELRKKR